MPWPTPPLPASDSWAAADGPGLPASVPPPAPAGSRAEAVSVLTKVGHGDSGIVAAVVGWPAADVLGGGRAAAGAGAGARVGAGSAPVRGRSQERQPWWSAPQWSAQPRVPADARRRAAWWARALATAWDWCRFATGNWCPWQLGPAAGWQAGRCPPPPNRAGRKDSRRPARSRPGARAQPGPGDLPRHRPRQWRTPSGAMPPGTAENFSA